MNNSSSPTNQTLQQSNTREKQHSQQIQAKPRDPQRNQTNPPDQCRDCDSELRVGLGGSAWCFLVLFAGARSVGLGGLRVTKKKLGLVLFAGYFLVLLGFSFWVIRLCCSGLSIWLWNSSVKTTTLLCISLSLPLLFQSLPFESLQFNLDAILFLSFLYFQFVKSTLSSDSLVFSMKAQSLVSGFCSNPTTPSIPNTKKSFFQTPTPPSSAYFSQSRKWVSFKIQHSAPQRVVWSNKQNGVEEAKDGTSHGNDLENGVRRKKLAVFVSGGGSNFRSIHEASLGGSVHGDFVVLVTNKRGFLSIFMYFYFI